MTVTQLIRRIAALILLCICIWSWVALGAALALDWPRDVLVITVFAAAFSTRGGALGRGRSARLDGARQSRLAARPLHRGAGVSAGAPASLAVRAAGLAGPLAFALSVVAAAQMAGAGAVLGAGLAGLIAIAAFVLMAWSLRRHALAGRERLPTPERAALRFQTFNVVWVVAFVLSFVFAAPLAAEAEHGAARFAYLAAPVAALTVLVAEFVRMIVLADEMERRQHITAVAIAGGGLVAAAAFWGVLEAGLPGLPAPQGWMLLPAFATLYAPTLMILQRGRA